jgi:glycosyltransferase involved in cell wall biosynthesis
MTSHAARAQPASPRRVLFCSQTANPRGGVETWLDTLCHRLEHRDWQPIVALVRGTKAHRPEAFREAHPDLETVEIDGRGLAEEGRVRATVRCVGHVRPSVFVPLIVADAHEAACRIKLAGVAVRYLLAMHGNVPFQVADVMRYADFIDLAVAPGRLSGQLVEWAGVPSHRIRRIPHGLHRPRHQRVQRSSLTPLRLGYVGRLTQLDKRVLDIAPLCMELRRIGVPFTFEVVGDGPESPALRRALAESGVAARFHGNMSQGDVYEHIYPQLDVLTLFSASEAFGLVLTEAMAHGIVPVCSRFLGHRAEGLLEDGATALMFDIGDTTSAAAAVARLAADRTLFAGLSEQAQARIAHMPSWDDVAIRWAEALDAATAAGPRVGKLPLRRIAGGRLDRFGLPAAFVDLLRRSRRRLIGIPPEFVGGEEWPWVHRDADPSLLSHIEEVSTRLDQPPTQDSTAAMG